MEMMREQQKLVHSYEESSRADTPFRNAEVYSSKILEYKMYYIERRTYFVCHPP